MKAPVKLFAHPKEKERWLCPQERGGDLETAQDEDPIVEAKHEKQRLIAASKGTSHFSTSLFLLT